MREEPEYRVFEGVCRECGAKVTYSNSVRLHSSKVICEKCRPRTVIRLAGKAKQVFSYMALLAKYRGNTTIGELARCQR